MFPLGCRWCEILIDCAVFNQIKSWILPRISTQNETFHLWKLLLPLETGLTMGQLLSMPSTSYASHFHLRRAIHEIETFFLHSAWNNSTQMKKSCKGKKRDEDERNVVDDATKKEWNVCHEMYSSFYCFTLFWACFCVNSQSLGN